jgi:iron complex outermembrane receptor protein
MLKPNSRAVAIAGAVALTMSCAARAQETIAEVTVTGSRIERTGMTTPTPVTAITADEIHLMAPGTMIEALSALPQFYGNTTNDAPGNFFSSPGAGNLNLRGLNTGNSSSRTLTLLNGRRLVPATRLGGTDINILPETMIKRVDTVTGGASAAYGTDAVAGVVNFILDTEYTGWQLHAQQGTTSRSDNDNSEFSAGFGHALGERGHLLLSAEYYEHDGVFSYEGRDWYESWGLITNPAGSAPQELRRPNVVSSTSTFGGLIVAPGSALNRRHFLPDGSAVPFVLGEGTTSGLGSHSITNGGSGDYVGSELQSIAPDAKRGSAFAYVDYDIAPKLNVFAQGIAGQSMTDAPNFGGLFSAPFSTQFTIFQNNAFLPADVRQTMINEGRQSFQLNRIGSREDTAASSRLKQDNKTYSGTLGFKLGIERDGMFNGWAVDGYYQYGTTRNRGYQDGGMRLDRIYAAVDAVVDPATGQIVCRAALVAPQQYGDCVPINYFGQGRASQAAVDYVTGFEPGRHITSPLYFTDSGYASGRTIDYVSGTGKVYRTDTEQRVAELSANGELWKGWGAGAIAAAIGVAWRKEEIDQTVEDPSNPASDPNVFPARNPAVRGVPSNANTRSSAIQNSTVPNIMGSYDVKEAFTEWQVPLLAEKKLVRQLTALASARWADYSGSGTIWAWKYGLDWQVVNSLRLRSTVSRDIRAGTLAERFDMTGGIGTVPAGDDPLFPNDPAQAITIRTGGNPNLAPEKADTKTFGVIYRPQWLEGFSVSVDYWDIDIAGAIGQLGVTRAVQDCVAGSPAACALVTRDPNTGRVIQVLNIHQNINSAAGRGVDVELSYARSIDLLGHGPETLRARVFGARMLENSTTNLGAAKVDRAGQTGIGIGLPEYSVTANLLYTNGPFGGFLQARYIDSGVRDVTQVQGVRIDNNEIDSVVYTDLRLSYTWETNGGAKTEFFANALNLFDEDPPVVPSFDAFSGASGQVNSSLFDLLGRRYTVGVTFRF